MESRMFLMENRCVSSDNFPEMVNSCHRCHFAGSVNGHMGNRGR